MAHKYLNKLGIKSNVTCIFNTRDKELDDKKRKRWKKQRKNHEFDERETWELCYTSATWLYEHIKMFKNSTKDIINLSYHKFNIPVLYDIPNDKLDLSVCCENQIANKYTKEVMEEHTQGEAIDLIIKYIEQYLLDIDHFNDYDFLEYHISETKAKEALQCAFKIYAEIINTMWW